MRCTETQPSFFLHAGSMSINSGTPRELVAPRRQNGIDKQITRVLVQFLLNTAYPQCDHMFNLAIIIITAAGAATPFSFCFFDCSTSQQSRYVLYIMRRRNKLVILRISSVAGRSNGQLGHHSTTSHMKNALISRTSAHLRAAYCVHLATRPVAQTEDWFE